MCTYIIYEKSSNTDFPSEHRRARLQRHDPLGVVAVLHQEQGCLYILSKRYLRIRSFPLPVAFKLLPLLLRTHRKNFKERGASSFASQQPLSPRFHIFLTARYSALNHRKGGWRLTTLSFNLPKLDFLLCRRSTTTAPSKIYDPLHHFPSNVHSGFLNCPLK